MGLNHRISFLSADNPVHFVSASLTHWRWSEVATSRADVFDRIMDRLRDKRAKCLQGLGDSVPEGINHYAELADIPGTGYDRLDEKRNVRAFIVPTDHNAHNLAPGYIEALVQRYSYDPSKLQSYRYGLFVPFQKSTAYWNFNESRNVVGDDVRPIPELPLALCWDFNVAPLAWTVHQRQPFYAGRFSQERLFRFVALDETDGRARGLEAAVMEFARKFPVHTWRHTPIEIHGDRSGYNPVHNTDAGCDYDQIVKYLRSAGFTSVTMKTPRANPGVRQSLEKMAQAMDYGLYVVHYRCKNLLDSYRKTALKEGTWDIDKPPKDTWTHYGDSARYYVFEMTKHLDLTKPDGGGGSLSGPVL
jgi:hypothetical protein